jgi:hypothetical protein
MMRSVLVISAACILSAIPCTSFGLNSGTLSCLEFSPRSRPARCCYPSMQALKARENSGEDQRSNILVSRRQAIATAIALQVFSATSQKALAASDEQWQEELGGSDGQGVNVKFVFPGSWKLDRKPGTLLINEDARVQCTENPDCVQGDVFTRSPGGDNAFLTLGTAEEALDKIPFTFFKRNIFNRGGKFGESTAHIAVPSMPASRREKQYTTCGMDSMRTGESSTPFS